VRRPGVGSNGGGKIGGGVILPTSNINACEVQLLLDQAYHRSHCVVQFLNSDDQLLQSSTALFSRSTDDKHLAKVYVPKSWAGTDVHVCLKYKNEEWYSNRNLERDTNGVIVLHDKDFTYKKIGFFSKHSKGIFIFSLMLLSLIAGGFIGAYVTKNYPGNNHQAFTCDRCDSVFDTQAQLTYHMQNVHNGDMGPDGDDPEGGINEPTLTCSDCGEGPFDENGLASHKPTCPKKVKCDNCDERFASESEMSVHKATAHPVVNYHCDICNRDFTTSASLKSHKADAHSPKECKHCHQTFDNKNALNDHLHKEHHFVCTECGPSTYFPTQADLDTHKRGKRKDGNRHSR